jgi:hypothetical protein
VLRLEVEVVGGGQGQERQGLVGRAQVGGGQANHTRTGGHLVQGAANGV